MTHKRQWYTDAHMISNLSSVNDYISLNINWFLYPSFQHIHSHSQTSYLYIVLPCWCYSHETSYYHFWCLSTSKWYDIDETRFYCSLSPFVLGIFSFVKLARWSNAPYRRSKKHLTSLSLINLLQIFDLRVCLSFTGIIIIKR